MNSIDFSKFCIWDLNQIDANSSSLDKYVIDMTKEYSLVDFLLSYNGVGCIPRGDLQAVTGKLKAGKTYACICILAAMLKGEYMGIQSLKDTKVLHIDTEQSAGNIVGRATILHSLCDWPEKENNDKLNIITLRECDYKDRLNTIEEAIIKFNPDFVLIDGVRDLCADFNDIKESSFLIGDLMRFCNQYKVAIMCVLHENKNDSNMRGHLGTELGNKCSEVYKISKGTSGIISVEQTISRNQFIDKWSFSINDKGIPQTESVSYVDKKKSDRNDTLQILFKNKHNYNYTELVNDFKPLFGCADRTAKSHIADALKEGVLFKNGTVYSFMFPDKEDPLMG